MTGVWVQLAGSPSEIGRRTMLAKPQDLGFLAMTSREVHVDGPSIRLWETTVLSPEVTVSPDQGTGASDLTETSHLDLFPLGSHVDSLPILCASGKMQLLRHYFGEWGRMFWVFSPVQLDRVNNLLQKENGQKCKPEQWNLPLLQKALSSARSMKGHHPQKANEVRIQYLKRLELGNFFMPCKGNPRCHKLQGQKSPPSWNCLWAIEVAGNLNWAIKKLERKHHI